MWLYAELLDTLSMRAAWHKMCTEQLVTVSMLSGHRQQLS